MLIVILVCMALFAIYLFLIAPSNKRRDAFPFSNWDYAHRGLFDNENIPENSLKAFQVAVHFGYGIELDVQQTKDGQLVVFHDDTLERMCGCTDTIASKTYEELLDYVLLDTDEQIPLLEEVLALVNGQVPLLIEIKAQSTNTSICNALLERMAQYEGLYMIESFNAFMVRWFAKNAPKVMRGQLSSNLLKTQPKKKWFYSFCGQYLLSNFLCRPDFIAYRYPYARRNLSFLLTAKIFKAITVIWTIVDEDTYATCAPLYDIIIFEGFPAKKRCEK